MRSSELDKAAWSPPSLHVLCAVTGTRGFDNQNHCGGEGVLVTKAGAGGEIAHTCPSNGDAAAALGAGPGNILVGGS